MLYLWSTQNRTLSIVNNENKIEDEQPNNLAATFSSHLGHIYSLEQKENNEIYARSLLKARQLKQIHLEMWKTKFN